MKSRIVPVNVELDSNTDQDIAGWAEKEGRSKRRHLAILARQLSELYAEKREELHKLGLVGAAAMN
jgi:hypothetical protein